MTLYGSLFEFTLPKRALPLLRSFSLTEDTVGEEGPLLHQSHSTMSTTATEVNEVTDLLGEELPEPKVKIIVTKYHDGPRISFSRRHSQPPPVRINR